MGWINVLMHLAQYLAAAPNPGPVAPPGLAGPADMLLGWLKWTGMVAGIVGFGACAIMMTVALAVAGTATVLAWAVTHARDRTPQPATGPSHTASIQPTIADVTW